MSRDDAIKQSIAGLSPGSKALWAKIASEIDSESWMPLIVHMLDSGLVCEHLWREWLPTSTKKRILEGLKNCGMNASENIIFFLAAIHDLGKATPAFQTKDTFPNIKMRDVNRDRLNRAGFKLPNIPPLPFKHATASQSLLEGFGIDESLSVIAGAHHGYAPKYSEVDEMSNDSLLLGSKDPIWMDVQKELFETVAEVFSISAHSLEKTRLDGDVQPLVSAIVIMCDWIASDERLFPYGEGITLDYERMCERASLAWNSLGISRWVSDRTWKEDRFQAYAGKAPRPMQIETIRVALESKRPGIMIIEAPMGEGKTEAAFAAAEILAAKYDKSGIMLALPTQATTDRMYERAFQWFDRAVGTDNGERYSISLMRTNASLNEDFANTGRSHWSNGRYESDGDRDLTVHDWLYSPKRRILSNFAIGTVDQILMAALNQKHMVLRHLGLCNKVVIIDEVHAYDVYMQQYLGTVLSWLGDYKVPVILLSATLQPSERKRLIEAYSPKIKGVDASTDSGYPLITYVEEDHIVSRCPPPCGKDRIVRILHCCPDEVVDRVLQETSDGGYAGIIVNIVSRAQKIYRDLCNRIGPDHVAIIHSRFTAKDRSDREKEIFDRLSDGDRHQRFIVVGTQVLEQSLDIDFDVMFTDLCPIDLLLQRIGRLHRHARWRVENLAIPRCYVIDVQEEEVRKEDAFIYYPKDLYNTRFLISGRDSITIPSDIPRLIVAAYEEEVQVPEEMREIFDDARRTTKNRADKSISRSEAFRILEPRCVENLEEISESHVSEENGKAAVRDTQDSVQAILVQSKDGEMIFPEWDEIFGGDILPRHSPLPREMARALSEYSVNLPAWIFNRGKMDLDSAVNASGIIRLAPGEWGESPWMKNAKLLVLDENLIGNYLSLIIRYNVQTGMEVIDGRDRVQPAGREMDPRENGRWDRENGRIRGGSHRCSRNQGTVWRNADTGLCNFQGSPCSCVPHIHVGGNRKRDWKA